MVDSMRSAFHRAKKGALLVFRRFRLDKSFEERKYVATSCILLTQHSNFIAISYNCTYQEF